MIIAMVGQPNSGKSTIFNHVAGYKAITSNFPGKTVKYTKSRIKVEKNVHTIVDLPGTYSLTSLDPAEFESEKYLLSGKADVAINVVDASLLTRSLELTIQLSELEIPYILCLNMMDEAKKKGIVIDTKKLEEEIGVPVVETIANKGIGINKVIAKAIAIEKKTKKTKKIIYSKHVEDAISALVPHIKGDAEKNNIPNRFFAIKLLENDKYFEKFVKNKTILATISRLRNKLRKDHGYPSDVVISSERHAESINIFERVANVTHAKETFTEKIDSFIMHKFYGYLTLIVILIAFFNIVFRVGNFIEAPLLDLFSQRLQPAILSYISSEFTYNLVSGIIEGIAGGVGIVLPYLFPFLIGLSLLEDVGYLPRIAFLLDAFLHKIGLHGKSIIPFILGYGCSVPAIMGTRILESPRDRFIVTTLTAMIPCAARITVILALVGFYLGANWAALVFLINIVIIVIIGYILSRVYPEITPGMMLEIPQYHLPSPRVVLLKTWFRIKEFIIIAWPMIILGSVTLSLLSYYGFDSYINTGLSPLTLLLGLPIAVGTTLIFGVLRKELAMLMLFQALGTENIIEVMTKTQILTFTVFLMFYIPCIATVGVMIREIGKRKTLIAISISLAVAILMSLFIRIGGMFWG
ncbi:MAG: ferrous iron transport protein B [Candidatus Methanofastidiosia archaeon]